MDFVVWYWDNVKNEVSVHDLNSKFLGHAAALDIIYEFNEGIIELNKGQLLQMSMDGASVNWAFLKEIQKHHEQEECHNHSWGISNRCNYYMLEY